MLHVVLIEPEIPQNTGSIGRLCLATQSRLHLVGPLGFELSDRQLKRAGLDYWEYLDVCQYESIETFLEQMPPDQPRVFLSKKAGQSIFDYRIQPDSYLFFGKETAGLPDWLLNREALHTVRIPMVDARVRSLNLAMSVGIALYEAIRQTQS